MTVENEQVTAVEPCQYAPVIPTKNNLTAFKQGGFVFVGGLTVGEKSVKTEN